MNKDHGDDTKLIVQHSTSIQVFAVHFIFSVFCPSQIEKKVGCSKIFVEICIYCFGSLAVNKKKRMQACLNPRIKNV